MTTVLLVGTGAVAGRAARQLFDTPGVERLIVSGRDERARVALAGAFGTRAEAIRLGGELPDAIDAVALAVPGRSGVRVAARAVEAGIPVASVADDEQALAGLLALDARARQTGALVALGCGLAPGLGDVLARHAADGFDVADEANMARVGAAGPECVAAMKQARRDRPREWRNGAWSVPGRVGAQLIWFPEPIGARECEVVAPGIELLRQTLPEVEHASLRVGEAPIRNAARGLVARRALDDGWGGARVEVWGVRDGVRATTVYGVIERPAVAAGTVLAVTTARLAGLLGELTLRDGAPGARALGAIVDPPTFLGELARRGVKAATFEGVQSN